MSALDEDYEQAQIAWTKKRYWHTGKREWVETWVGEVTFGKCVPSDPDAFLVKSARIFKARKQNSKLAERVYQAFLELGPSTSKELADYLSTTPHRINRCLIDNGDRFEKMGYYKGRMVYRLIEQRSSVE